MKGGRVLVLEVVVLRFARAIAKILGILGACG